MKELARAQCEAAAQLRHQQLQQQQQQQTQPQPQQPGTMLHRPLTSSTIPRGNCTAKIPNSTVHHHPRTQYHPQYKHQLHHEHTRHAQMSPALLTLSASPAAHNHSSIDVHRRPTSPPATPGGDHSPTSPVNKSLNRSQHHLQRDASGSVSPGIPAATLDLSSAANTNSPHELSTLV